MRAITLKQPWATLLVKGVKHHETRSWKLPPDLIGRPILIHAGLAYEVPPHMDMIRGLVMAAGAGPEQAPRGAILGSVTFDACHRVTLAGGFPVKINMHQFCFGDYAPNRWYWTVLERKLFDAPIHNVRGRLGIWTYEGEYPL